MNLKIIVFLTKVNSFIKKKKKKKKIDNKQSYYHRCFRTQQLDFCESIDKNSRISKGLDGDKTLTYNVDETNICKKIYLLEQHGLANNATLQKR